MADLTVYTPSSGCLDATAMQDGVVTAGVLNGNILTLQRSGGLPDIDIDLSTLTPDFNDPAVLQDLVDGLANNPAQIEALAQAIADNPTAIQNIVNGIINDPVNINNITNAIVADPANVEAITTAIANDPAAVDDLLQALANDPNAIEVDDTFGVFQFHALP